MTVKPLVQITAQVEYAISEFAVPRPPAVMAPLTQRTSRGDQSEFGVSRFIITIRIETMDEVSSFFGAELSVPRLG